MKSLAIALLIVGFISTQYGLVAAQEDDEFVIKDEVEPQPKTKPPVPVITEPPLRDGSDGGLIEGISRAGMTSAFNHEYSRLYVSEFVHKFMSHASQGSLPDNKKTIDTPGN